MKVLASPLAGRGAAGCDFGLDMDTRWAPSWPAELIDWQDFGSRRDGGPPVRRPR